MSKASTPPTDPVHDWTTDYDIFDAEYVVDPTPVWSDLRAGCPMARTDRRGIRSWLPTKYADVQALAKIVPELSSKDPLVVTLPADMGVDNSSGLNAPPISADPPEQVWTRRMILPAFSPKAVEAHRAFTTNLANELIDGFIDRGSCDAAVDYAQQIPPRVIAHFLGFDPSRADEFVEWVRGVLELGLFDPKTRVKYRDIVQQFLIEEVVSRRQEPTGRLSLRVAHDGRPRDEGSRSRGRRRHRKSATHRRHRHDLVFDRFGSLPFRHARR